MHRPELLLQVVRREEVQRGGELEEQVVLKAKDGCGSDECGLGEDASGNFLASCLQAYISSVWIRRVRSLFTLVR